MMSTTEEVYVCGKCGREYSPNPIARVRVEISSKERYMICPNDGHFCGLKTKVDDGTVKIVIPKLEIKPLPEDVNIEKMKKKELLNLSLSLGHQLDPTLRVDEIKDILKNTPQ